MMIKAKFQRLLPIRHVAWFLLLLLLPGCGREEKSPNLAALEFRVSQLEKEFAALKGSAPVPRLGGIMGMVQMRHAKLWLAAERENWDLAAYELEELKEDFDDVEKFHPTRGTPPVRLDFFVRMMMKPLLEEVRKAIRNRSRTQFAIAFDTLTTDCNQCHLAAAVPANFITRPTAVPFGNQDFAPRPPDGTK